MTDLATQRAGSDIERARTCRQLALDYLECLDELIALPARREEDALLTLGPHRAVEFRSLILDDIKRLDKMIGDVDGHLPHREFDGLRPLSSSVRPDQTSTPS